jgi:hypothetical protein
MTITTARLPQRRHHHSPTRAYHCARLACAMTTWQQQQCDNHKRTNSLVVTTCPPCARNDLWIKPVGFVPSPIAGMGTGRAGGTRGLPVLSPLLLPPSSSPSPTHLDNTTHAIVHMLCCRCSHHHLRPPHHPHPRPPAPLRAHGRDGTKYRNMRVPPPPRPHSHPESPSPSPSPLPLPSPSLPPLAPHSTDLIEWMT